jgi:hypothetical protein
MLHRAFVKSSCIGWNHVEILWKQLSEAIFTPQNDHEAHTVSATDIQSSVKTRERPVILIITTERGAERHDLVCQLVSSCYVCMESAFKRTR